MSGLLYDATQNPLKVGEVLLIKASPQSKAHKDIGEQPRLIVFTTPKKTKPKLSLTENRVTDKSKHQCRIIKSPFKKGMLSKRDLCKAVKSAPPKRGEGHLCKVCNKPFQAKRKDAKYCSGRCRIMAMRKKE